MVLLEQLTKARDTEKNTQIIKRIMMVIAFLTVGTFSGAGRNTNYDRRTVAKWWNRLKAARKTPKGIREAFADRPRSGAPTKIDKKVLEEVRKWCEGRAFETQHVSDKLFEMSNVRLSDSQVRRYMKKWGHSKKKTEPVEIKRALMGTVRVWRHRLFAKIERLEKLGYTTVTMDEMHVRDSERSRKFWSKIGVRVYSLWSGNHKRFSLLASMTSDGNVFMDYATTANTDTFLAHIDRVYQKVGKMVLVLDRASYHKSQDAMKFFKERDIKLVWYPAGHPYLNPVEEMWHIIRMSVSDSIRYADAKSHLNAVFNFVKLHKFDYDFTAFWSRRPNKGILLPFIRIEGELDPSITMHEIVVPKKKKKKKK